MITVLMIDDDELVLRATSRLLEGCGYRVLRASSPEQAKPLYAQADCVLTDWDMPHGGGARVLEEAQRLTVVYSGNPEIADLLRARGVALVGKPASVAELRAALEGSRT